MPQVLPTDALFYKTKLLIQFAGAGVPLKVAESDLRIIRSSFRTTRAALLASLPCADWHA
jgi:hypothetical protein